MGKSTEDRKLVIRGRVHISIKLSEHWQWKQANGHLKDRACRSILQSLFERGLIQLPASKRASSCNIVAVLVK
ncbi:MAG: hypothetical protein D8M57_18455 [Candidatus Scalindua sp. AMX11]|nr:MAG: hypothetical protein DWQ00_04480 [Candidatus Scalindua sp.]NOG83647.1 hypothetical protein [Planctomycetota bacterium]RZV63222.1 MAG: hypothetical protein EX341_18360 [Candidatus Scalindua sp. SCAELEC01]TDE63401.1 MAG: hypothetical protein D8M57_18455 [Candidatus Scalindua sp. AMX11]GJQ57343.1 MAG: hypothetical protein SCALA701_01440 [Candidatus Scalindua sp.]